MTDRIPVTPVPAATLLLVRDGAQGLEVLMAARHEESGFAAGALVFPGGKVDAGDTTIARSCGGLAGLVESAAAARVAAIRETWEECGVLLARSAGGELLLTRGELSRLRERHGARFEPLVREARLELCGDRLVPFAHWITPADRPKRFDTLFFMAPFDSDQEALHDGREAIDARWVRPADVIADADAGRLKLVFATRINLLRLGQSNSVAAAMAAARAATVVTVTPQIATTPAGPVLRIPPEAGYSVCELPLDKVQRA
jgi:8-oxo-dGTP pyrophosphatase MutT (NUDIX family)